MKNKRFLLLISIFVFCMFFSMEKIEAAPATGGLWGQYSKYSDPHKSEFKEVNVDNLDFKNFDEILKQRIGQRDDAEIIWRGGVYADKNGEYVFRIDNQNSRLGNFVIDGGYYCSSKWNFCSVSVYLKKGWHKISLSQYVGKGYTDSSARFFWTQPGGKEEIVPKDHLTYKFWSDNVLTIPSDGTKKRLDYVVAGAGVDGVEGGEGLKEGKIVVDMPANVLDNDVWVIWYKKKGESNKIVIKNEFTGASKMITGEENLDSMGLEAYYPEVYANISKSLIVGDGSGKLRLSFRKASPSEEEFSNGISLVVPFEDNTKPEGKLSIRMVAATGYQGASPVMTFPVTSGSKISPMFFFPNGESKTGSEFRPNYLVMLTGKPGQEPGEVSTLIRDGDTKIIVPQVGSSISKSNEKTWYPLYGREGRQLDVLSSKYVPNQWSDVSSQYSGSQDGKIDEIEIPAGHTWVAFQYYGSNFSKDGIDGAGESGSISGGGLFSEKGLDEFDLETKVTGNGDVTSDVGAIDCPDFSCKEQYANGTNVTLTAAPDSGWSFSGWSGDCSYAGTNLNCSLTVDSQKTADATFSATAIPKGICSSADGGTFCGEPAQKCSFGSVTNENYDPATKTWTWKCTSGGGDSPTCSAKRNCQIQEVNP